jgi:hypothetical protein
MRQTLILLLLLLTTHLTVRFIETPFGPPPAMPDPIGICAHLDENGSLVGFACKGSTQARLDAGAQDALGQPPCWWTVTADTLQRSIDGVGAGTARELVQLRNRGVRPTLETVRRIPRVSDATAAAVVRVVQARCGPLRAPHKPR